MSVAKKIDYSSLIVSTVAIPIGTMIWAYFLGNWFYWTLLLSVPAQAYTLYKYLLKK